MNISTIISMVRNQTNVSSSNFLDSQILDYINIVYQDLSSAITSIDENYFYESWTTDIVSAQNEYALPSLKKLIGVFVKSDTWGSSMIKLEEENIITLTQDLTDYEVGSQSFFVLADNSVFIYPKPKQDIPSGLKINGIANLVDLVLGNTETDIKIPREYHHLLVLGASAYIYSSLGKSGQRDDVMNQYNLAKQEMLDRLSNRTISVAVGELPDLEFLA